MRRPRRLFLASDAMARTKYGVHRARTDYMLALRLVLALGSIQYVTGMEGRVFDAPPSEKIC